MARTRRAFATADTSAPDPIFAALERTRRACAPLETVDEWREPARFAAVGRELSNAREELFETQPTTLAGCQALIEHVLDDNADEADSDLHRTLVTVLEVLERLA